MVAAAGCDWLSQPTNSSDGSGPSPSVAVSLELSPSKPVLRTSPPTGGAKDVIVLEVIRVTNPRAQSWGLRVTIESGTAVIQLGTVSLFPADTPGAYTLPLQASASLLAEEPGAELVIQLISLQVGQALIDPLEVRISPPRWHTRPEVQ